MMNRLLEGNYMTNCLDAMHRLKRWTYVSIIHRSCRSGLINQSTRVANKQTIITMVQRPIYDNVDYQEKSFATFQRRFLMEQLTIIKIPIV